MRYIRDYKITFLVDGDSVTEKLVYSSVEQVSRGLRPQHIKFTTSYGTGPSVLKLSIFNMSPVSRFKLQSQDVKVLVEVGFRDTEFPDSVTLATVFLGEVSGPLTTTTTAADHETKIIAKDGSALNDLKISTSFPPGTSHMAVIKSLMEDVTEASGGMVRYDSSEIDALGITKVYKKGHTITGVVLPTLTKLLSTFNLDFVVAQGILRIRKEGKSIVQNTVHFSTESGLLTVPKPTAQKAGQVKSDSLPTKGFKFKVLLSPELVPTSRVSVTHQILGDDPIEMIVNKVTHKGGYESNEWFTEIEAVIESDEIATTIAKGRVQPTEENIEYHKLLTQGNE